jgi:hypothetical protein
MSMKVTYKVVKDIDSKTFVGLRRLKGLHNKGIRVGLPEGKVYRERDEKGKLKMLAKKAKRIMIAMIGAVHEFGSPTQGIPARPWLRPGVKSGTPDYVRLNRRNLLRIIDGSMSIDIAFKQLGAMAVGKVQNYLRDSSHFQALKQSTIDAKGSSKPLIDTGQMMQSVTYEVVDKI